MVTFEIYPVDDEPTIVASLGAYWITARGGAGRKYTEREYWRWRKWVEETLEEMVAKFPEPTFTPLDLEIFKTSWFRWESVLGYCFVDIPPEQLIGIRAIVRKDGKLREIVIAQKDEHTYIIPYGYVNDFVPFRKLSIKS